MVSTLVPTNAMIRTSRTVMAAQVTAKLSEDGSVLAVVPRRGTSAVKSAETVSISASFSVTMETISMEMGKL